MPRKPSKARGCKPANKTVRADGTVVCSRYSKALTRAICLRIAAGEAWYRIANTDNMPAYDTLYAWLRKYPDFAEDYAQAREIAADLRADKALEVAEASTAATASADRLRVSALQWRAAKGSPKRYGPKAGEAAGGAEDGSPRRLIIEVRQFERAWRDDGTPYVREVILPETKR